MATPPAGATVDRRVEVELQGVIENKRAGGGCHPWLVLPVFSFGPKFDEHPFRIDFLTQRIDGVDLWLL